MYLDNFIPFRGMYTGAADSIIDARLQLDDYIVSPSTCMKQGIGNNSPDRNFNFQQEVVIPTQLLKICYNNEQVL